MYNFREVDKLINRYSSFENSEVVQLSEGVLGSGNWILTAPGKKTAIITEIFVNEWSGTHTIRLYNKTPKKYLKMLIQ